MSRCGANACRRPSATSLARRLLTRARLGGVRHLVRGRAVVVRLHAAAAVERAVGPCHHRAADGAAFAGRAVGRDPERHGRERRHGLPRHLHLGDGRDPARLSRRAQRRHQRAAALLAAPRARRLPRRRPADLGARLCARRGPRAAGRRAGDLHRRRCRARQALCRGHRECREEAGRGRHRRRRRPAARQSASASCRRSPR